MEGAAVNESIACCEANEGKSVNMLICASVVDCCPTNSGCGIPEHGICNSLSESVHRELEAVHLPQPLVVPWPDSVRKVAAPQIEFVVVGSWLRLLVVAPEVAVQLSSRTV